MKINRIENYSQANNTSNKSKTAFKGHVATECMDFLVANPVWGATFVDAGSMGTPRTIIDLKKKGVSGGAETGIREFSSTTNDACIGLYGLLAGTLLSKTLSKSFGLKDPQRIFASNESLDIHKNKWEKNARNEDKYIKDIVDNLSGFNPHDARADVNGYVKIEDKYKQGIIDDMKSIISGDLSNKETKIARNRLNARILEATGSNTEIMLKDDANSLKTSVDTLIDDYHRVTKAFKENTKPNAIDGLVSKVKNFSKARAVLGLGLAMAVASSVQPINNYLTKKRTGSDGFAGMPGREKDRSFGFQVQKVVHAAGMAALALASLNAKPAQLIDKVLFKGTIPTIDQFKAMYAITICSRMLVARDKDELGESTRKDVLGFLNWLIIGNLVNKGVVMAMENKDNPVIRYNKEATKNGFVYKHFGEGFDKFIHGNISSRKEILTEVLTQEGKSIVKPNGKAMKVGEMADVLSTIKTPKALAAKKNLKIFTIGQIANYLYSGIVLGAGIPLMNVAITNKKVQKRHEQKLQNISGEKNHNFVFTSSNFENLTSFKGSSKQN